MKTKKLPIIATAACLLIALILGYIFYLFQQEFEKTTVSAAQQQLLMVAKSTATCLEKIVRDYSEALRTLSSNPSIQEELHKGSKYILPSVTYCPFKTLYEIHKEEADALTTLDANGIMQHRHPFIENRIGKDHTDKPGVAYVIRERQPYVSELFYNNLGDPSISISEPVFYEGEFAGIVRWMIQLDTISKRFIQPIGVGKKCCAWMLDSNGTMLSHPKAEHIGRHIMEPRKEKFPDKDWTELEDIVEKMTNGEEGVGVYHSAWWPEKDLKITKKLIAYAPVRVGNTFWSLSVVMSYSEIADPIRRNAIKTFGLAWLIISLFGATGIVFFRIRRKKVELEIEAKYFKEIAESAEALKKARDKLEIRVEERTSELAAANEKLLVEITERKRAEEELKQKGVFLESVFDAIQDGITVRDLEFNLVQVNRWMEKKYASEIPLLGKKCYEVFQKRQTICPWCPALPTMKTGKPQRQVVPYPSADDPIGWLELSAFPLKDTEGKIIGCIEHVRDITERKQIEEELKRYREYLEELVAERTAELEAFSYSVSHDLRAPLRAMQGFAQALVEDCAEKLNTIGRDYSHRIMDAAEHMEALIEDLLEYSHLSRTDIHLAPVNLERIVEEVLAQLKAEIKEKGAEVTVNKPLLQVSGHHPILVQAVTNLVENSLKFVPPDISPQIRIWAEDRDKYIRLWLKDNGIGIAPEHHERIFQVFERLHGIEAYPGTGIGLAIVRKGITRMNGRCGVESALSQGSRFWIELLKVEEKP